MKSDSDPSTHPDPSPQLEPVLSDLVLRMFRKVVDRSRTELGRAAKSGRSQLELRQLQKDLDHFWVRLGKTTARLVQGGEIDHPALRKALERIDEIEAKIDELRRSSSGLSDR